MLKYCIKRLLLSVLILFGVSLIIYVLVRLMPGGYIEQMASTMAQNSGGDQLKIEADLRAYYGLDGSIISGYWNWLTSFLSGDFGTSIVKNQPVEEIIFENMGVSFTIAFVALILELLIAIPLGIKCAVNQYGKLDYAATVFTMIGISFPTFFLGNILIKFLAVDLGWFPATGLNSSLETGVDWWTKFGDTLWHLILPMFVLVVLNIGAWMRYTRTNTLEVLNADYIRTARAKGLSEKSVVYKHVFRNTLIPLVTLLAGTLPSLFGGALITETVFGIPGIGKTAYDLMQAGDIPFIMGYNMFIAFLTVIGILLTDIMYAIVDPRVKLG
ncbi:MAG: ABC transporter permease [Clostridiales bacterium]|nr:ABC transporter permease [Clostridiales bacterium]